MTDIEQERAVFEAWAMANCPGRTLVRSAIPDDDREYIDLSVDRAWQGWLARASRPMEVTEGMVERAAKAYQDQYDGIDWADATAGFKSVRRMDMRAVLTAALSPPGREGE